MIDRKDLRIGNFVSHNGVAGSGKIIAPIEAIFKAIGRTIIVARVRDSSDNFEPIPLTEKILIDSGFEKTDYRQNAYAMVYGEKTFLVSFGTEIIFEVISKTLIHREIPCHSTEFVHNLQNAYRLATGQDLDLVIG